MRSLQNVIGIVIGTILFLLVAVYLFGNPFGEWFMSAHAMLVSEKRAELTEEQNIQIYKLMSQGIVVSTDSILDKITTVYGNVIQVLIGTIAAITIMSFFAIRWMSMQAAQDMIDAKMKEYFASSEYNHKVTRSIHDFIDIHGFTNEDYDNILSRIEKIEHHISKTKSQEEPSED